MHLGRNWTAVGGDETPQMFVSGALHGDERVGPTAVSPSLITLYSTHQNTLSLVGRWWQSIASWAV